MPEVSAKALTQKSANVGLVVVPSFFIPHYFRLSYHQRILDVVPENFKVMCPENPEVNFKYKGEPGSGKTCCVVYRNKNEL